MDIKDTTFFDIQDNEKDFEYINRICEAKRQKILLISWNEIAEIINNTLGLGYSESTYRKKFFTQYDKLNYINMPYDEYNLDDTNYETFDEICEPEKFGPEEEDDYSDVKARYKLMDIMTQTRANLRRISREESIIEIAKDYATKMANSQPLCSFLNYKDIDVSGEEAILCISDWHYGIEIDSHWNKYCPETAIDRISTLFTKTLAKLKKEKINKLHLVNLGDLICGRIHLTLRLQSRIDVITQIMDVSEILASNIARLVKNKIKVEYYDCLDNHSRLEPKKSDSLELETLSRLLPWYLKERLRDFIDADLVNINNNKFDDDIITFEALNHKIACVHGHKDYPGKIVDSLTTFTRENFDLICAAHYHHFSGDEKNETIVIGNGSLMGVDTYAKNLRLSSKPSQNLVIMSKENVIENVCRILV